MSELSLSVVIPVHQGAPYLAALVERFAELRTSLRESGGRLRLLEVICVVDEARDDSESILRDLQSARSWLRLITLSRNFGQHPATVAGILHSSGHWVATLDEDLQHAPEDIVTMWELAVSTHADLIYASPRGETHTSAFRRLTSRWYKSLIAAVSGISSAVHFNSFRLIRGEVARGTASICGGDLYLDAALSWFTDRVRTCPLDLRDTRTEDGFKSTYSVSRLITHAGHLLFSARLRVLRLGGLLGLSAVGFSVLYSAYLVLRKVLYPESITVSGWTSQMLVTLITGGVILFMLSIVLEYMMLTFLRVQGKPTFFTVDRSSDEEE